MQQNDPWTLFVYANHMDTALDISETFIGHLKPIIPYPIPKENYRELLAQPSQIFFEKLIDTIKKI